MKKIYLLFVLTGIIACISGCGSGGGSSKPAPTVDITGTWDIDIFGSPASWILLTVTQTGAALTGTAVTDLGDEFNVSGSVSADNITLQLAHTLLPSYWVRCTGTATETTASGDWIDSDSDTGTWNGVKF